MISSQLFTLPVFIFRYDAYFVTSVNAYKIVLNRVARIVNFYIV